MGTGTIRHEAGRCGGPGGPRSMRARAAVLAAAFVSLVLVTAAANGSSSSRTPQRGQLSRLAASTAQTEVRLRLRAPARLRLTLAVAAARADAPAAPIIPIGRLPEGAVIDVSGRRTVVTWAAAASGKAGTYTLSFGSATSTLTYAVGAGRPAKLSGPGYKLLTYTVTVLPNGRPIHYPRRWLLTQGGVAHWAPVLRRIRPRTLPSGGAPFVRQIPRPGNPAVMTDAILTTATPDGTQNLVRVLQAAAVSPGTTWYEVSLPILPQSVGWVPAGALGDLNAVHTHLYIDLTRLRLTLKVNGRYKWGKNVEIGVGAFLGGVDYRTPTGEFYLRERLPATPGDAFYGPVAFATSARCPHPGCDDWPASGFVGLHGTNQPELLPGHVSHGCIRMPDSAIETLARLVGVGTPVTISR